MGSFVTLKGEGRPWLGGLGFFMRFVACRGIGVDGIVLDLLGLAVVGVAYSFRHSLTLILK